MDSRPDEQLRGITMKSSAVSLHHKEGRILPSSYRSVLVLLIIVVFLFSC
jgi:translation elongation factor EF-G